MSKYPRPPINNKTLPYPPLCAKLDTALFFPLPGETEQEQFAKSVCERCPNLDPCREGAIERNEQDGIWGGTGPRDRRRERARRYRERQMEGDRAS